MDEIEFFKVVAGISSAAAVGAVASHVRVRERVARLEERVITLSEKVDATLGGIQRLETNGRAQALQTDRMAIQVEAIMDTLQRRPMPGRE
jgi:hypothetical protein